MLRADLFGMNLHNYHFRFIRIAAILFALAISWPSGTVVSQDAKSPKTLFRWTLADVDREEGEHADRIVTDRPHFSEASNLVGLGRVQLETGYSYFRDANNGTVVQTHSFGEPLLRAGVFAEWFEFRLGYTYLVGVQPNFAPHARC